MNVLFAVFEADPFAKTGGLGDVGGALPIYLREAGVDVRVIMPKHASIPDKYRSKLKHVAEFHLQLGWRTLYCGLDTLRHKGVTYYFIDNEYYFKRDSLYGFDDAERVAFFCKATLECLTHIERFKPQVIHCNDWHTALIPVMLKEYFGDHPYYYDIRTILTIHNLKFQGIVPKYLLGDFLHMEHHVTAQEHLAWNSDAINFMKGGLLYADAITTVSPSYAEEIKTEYYGEGLDSVLRWRSHQLHGILNGIDYAIYDPANDERLFHPYRCGDPAGKQFNKKALQGQLKLPDREDVPLFIMVSRFTEQKGLDLLAHILGELLNSEDIQMAVLGTGDWRYEEMFYHFSARFPEKLAARITYDDTLAHRLYAAGDALLMPSRFEPCGISQMIGMRYSTLPIVRETGGLKDTVIPYNQTTGEGTGFGFANYNAHELLFAIQQAIHVYRNDPTAWKRLQQNACAADFSWQASAEKYNALYHTICEKD